MPPFPPHLQTLRHIFINPAIQEEGSRVCLETPTQSASRILLWFLLGSICIVILVTQSRSRASNELSDPSAALQLPYAAPRSSTRLTGCCWERRSDRLAQTEKYCMFPELCSSSRNDSCLFLPSLQTFQNAGSGGWWDGLGGATRTRQHPAVGLAGVRAAANQWTLSILGGFLHPSCSCREVNSHSPKLYSGSGWLAVPSGFPQVSFQYLNCRSKYNSMFLFFPALVLSCWCRVVQTNHLDKKILTHSGRKGDGSCFISAVGAVLQTSSILSPVSLRQKGPRSSFRNTKGM